MTIEELKAKRDKAFRTLGSCELHGYSETDQIWINARATIRECDRKIMKLKEQQQ